MEIEITTENLVGGCVTDKKQPRFSFKILSEKQNVELESAEIRVGEWKCKTCDQLLIPYGGEPLKPFTEYKVKVTAENNHGEKARAVSSFFTGRMDTPWKAKWISDGKSGFWTKRLSSAPSVFRKKFAPEKGAVKAEIYCSATGNYEITLNGGKIGGDDSGAEKYRVYDITAQLNGECEILVTVDGAEKRALLLEIRMVYDDGAERLIATDGDWEVCESSENPEWRKVKCEKLSLSGITAAASRAERSGNSFTCSDKLLNKLYSDSNGGKGGADASALWAEYFVSGDIQPLEENYEALKKSVKAEKRSKDAILLSCGIMEKVADLLGKQKDAAAFKDLFSETAEEYVSALEGRLFREQQKDYALALYCGAFPEDKRKKAADNLKKLVEINGLDNTAAPYILYALADNGQAEAAFGILTNTEKPYTSYTAASFLTERVAGIVPSEAGFRRFMIKPLIGGGLSYAKGEVQTPYGKVISEWKTQGARFSVKIRVPACAECDVYLPNGESIGVGSGEYEFTSRLN